MQSTPASKHDESKSQPMDRKAIVEQLQAVLATELICVLRYRSHYYAASGILGKMVKDEFLEHAEEEFQHAMKIAERITELDGVANFSPEAAIKNAHVKFVTSTDVKEMIQQNLDAERIAVDSYRKLIQTIGDSDPTTRRLLEEVLAQEEEHQNDMAELLETPSPVSN